MPATHAYQRVPQSEQQAADPAARAQAERDAQRRRKERAEMMEKINNKLHAICWVLAASALAYWTDLPKVVMEDERVDRTWLNVGLVCVGVNTVIFLYLAFWLPYVEGNTMEWAVSAPRAIPTATIVGTVATIAILGALWPVWGFLTLPILSIAAMGMLMSCHFVPFL